MIHGAGAPQVRKSAKRRLMELAEPAVEALRLALESGDIRAVTRAAIAVLDRTGHHPRQRVEVEATAPGGRGGSEWMPWATTDELRTFVEIGERVEQRRLGGEPPCTSGPVARVTPLPDDRLLRA